jgi:hypothetical protein
MASFTAATGATAATVIATALRLATASRSSTALRLATTGVVATAGVGAATITMASLWTASIAAASFWTATSAATAIIVATALGSCVATAADFAATATTTAQHQPIEQLKRGSVRSARETQQANREQGWQQRTTLHWEGSLIRNGLNVWNITVTRPLAPLEIFIVCGDSVRCLVMVQQHHSVLISPLPIV